MFVYDMGIRIDERQAEASILYFIDSPQRFYWSIFNFLDTGAFVLVVILGVTVCQGFWGVSSFGKNNASTQDNFFFTQTHPCVRLSLSPKCIKKLTQICFLMSDG